MTDETRYELQHPLGTTISVTAARRDVFLRRGYTLTGASETPKPRPGTVAAAARRPVGRPKK